ncbi:hypothetical protein [Desulfatitalea alkaliphila]|uniref:Uncharacterized protein n=1 Tax=Desulfatitalea alkaliphila TaxID=2929485 RepID=A0AA41R4A7_9BACT|nr:hypothetical protein [Desulfatitalea alkaliphila]MCJ8502699.1 hypothetical protein [Desulfatitalea alkaliphila]
MLVKFGYVLSIADVQGLYASYGSALNHLARANRSYWMPPAFWGAYDLKEDMEPLTPGRQHRLDFALGPLSYIFKLDHRIRLTITCVQPEVTPEIFPEPQVFVWFDAIRRSSLDLPVIDTSPIKATVKVATPQHRHGKKGLVFRAREKTISPTAWPEATSPTSLSTPSGAMARPPGIPMWKGAPCSCNAVRKI